MDESEEANKKVDNSDKTASHLSILQSEESATRILTKEKVKSTIRRLKKECTIPTGLLGIHVKKLTLDNLNMYALFQRFDATVYVRLSCQGQMKCSKAYADVIVPSVIFMDDLSHFRVRVSNHRSDPDNFIKVQLMAFTATEPRIHKVVSTKDIHLY